MRAMWVRLGLGSAAAALLVGALAACGDRAAPVDVTPSPKPKVLRGF